MAEAPGAADSSDDSVSSLSDPESWNLHFDLPDNDQTWLFCPSGVDPMSREDLDEYFASQRCKNDVSSQEILKELCNTPKAAKGETFDSRTFTRPKKQNPNSFNSGSSLTNLQNLKVKQILPESTIDGNKCSNLPKNTVLNRSISVETLIIDNNLDSSDSSVSMILSNTKQNIHSILFRKISLIQHTSFPNSFQNISYDMEKSWNLDSVYQTGVSKFVHYSSNENTNNNDKSSNKDLVNSLKMCESQSSWSTPPNLSSCKMHSFDPQLVSTPITSQKVETSKNAACIMNNGNCNGISNKRICDATYMINTSKNENETSNVNTDCIKNMECYIKNNDTHCIPRSDTIKTDSYDNSEGAEPLKIPLTASAQRNLKEEETVSKIKNVSSHKDHTLTQNSPRIINKTFSFKEDINDSKTNYLLSERTLLENISHPPHFLSDLSLNDANLTSQKDESNNECKKYIPEIDSECLKSTSPKDSQTKAITPTSKAGLPTPSPEKHSKNSAGFNFRPTSVSTPIALQGLRYSKEEPVCNNTSIDKMNDLCYKNNNTVTNPNEKEKTSNLKANSILNTTVTLNNNEINVQEPYGSNTLLDTDKGNANYMPENVYRSCKTTSIESVNKNMKMNKEKDEDSAPDSCYSSSSNIRSIGDVCGIIQHPDNINFPTSMRKSVSHDSLLSQETTFKAPSNFQKHESMLTLIPTRGGHRDKVNHDAKNVGASSRFSRGGRTFCKPRFSVRNSDFENINPNETFRVDKQDEERALPSRPSVARPSFTSKLPVLSQKTRIPKPQFRMNSK